jgi:hypothetical protein
VFVTHLEESMIDLSFHTFTRRPAAVSRRASPTTPGSAGLAALTAPVTTDAKNRKTRRRCKKDKKQCKNDLAECNALSAQCAPQVEQCTTFLTALCAGEPECLDSIACCSTIGNCDANAFLACLFLPS